MSGGSHVSLFLCCVSVDSYGSMSSISSELIRASSAASIGSNLSATKGKRKRAEIFLTFPSNIHRSEYLDVFQEW